MKNTKTNKIVKKLTAFTNGYYNKQEYLREFNLLQVQMANMIGIEQGFNGGAPRLQDVYTKLKQMNADTNNLANDLFVAFDKQSWIAKNEIMAILQGESGENKAQKSLDTVRGYCKVLRNIELQSEHHRTELDFVVITSSKIFIIEVKNTKRDILIDEQGNYQRLARHGEYVFDKNIGQQINEKEYLLRQVLLEVGINDVPIKSVVVFTDSSINVINKFEYIKTCYLSQLPYIIGKATSANYITKYKMEKIENAIKAAHCEQPFSADIDIEQLKLTFAQLIVGLKDAQKKTAKQKTNFLTRFFQRLGTAFACLIS